MTREQYIEMVKENEKAIQADGLSSDSNIKYKKDKAYTTIEMQRMMLE